MDIESRRFTATDIGKIVSRFLTKYFTKYVEYGFTADMEDELDAVSRGEEPWTTPLEKFWKPFIVQVEDVEKNVTREQVAQARELGKDAVSGKPVTVRMGRFGPFVQIGTKDDVEKPRFAGLRPGQKMDTIQLPEAMELFKLPRTLGVNSAGETVLTAIGRFGPYIKYGAKYVSLKEDDPYTVSFERALEVIQAKQIADANRLIQDFPEHKIQVLNGRYGPYITDTAKNARVPKDRDPKSLTLEECQTLLAAAPAKGTRGRFGRRFPAKTAAAGATTAASGAAAPKGAAARAAAKAAAPKVVGAKAGAAKTPATKVPAAKAATAKAGVAKAVAAAPKKAPARAKSVAAKKTTKRPAA